MAFWLRRAFGLPHGLREFKSQPIDDMKRWTTSRAYESHECPPDSTRQVLKKSHDWQQGEANPRVLVVEDDPDTRLALCDILEGHGYACVAAEHGAGAVEILLVSPLDVVITDYQMPVMDGLQLIEWLEKASGQNHPPVILLTGDMNERVREKATRGGVHTILPKPYELQELLSTLAMAIGSYKQNQKD